jgi:hypothetical protein
MQSDASRHRIEKAQKFLLQPVINEVIQKLRKAAASIDKDDVEFVDTTIVIAQLSQEIIDIEKARQAATVIQNAYERAKVFASIAQLSHEARDIEEVRKAADNADDEKPVHHWGSEPPKTFGARSLSPSLRQLDRHKILTKHVRQLIKSQPLP